MHDRQFEDQILSADDARLRAVCAADVAALDNLLGPAFVYIHRNGEVDTRAEYLARMGSGKLVYRQPARSGVKLHVHGPTVIMTGRLAIDVELVAERKTLKLDNIFMSVWAKSGNAWSILGWSSVAAQA